MIMETQVEYLHLNTPCPAYLSLMADHGAPHSITQISWNVYEKSLVKVNNQN